MNDICAAPKRDRSRERFFEVEPGGNKRAFEHVIKVRDNRDAAPAQISTMHRHPTSGSSGLGRPRGAEPCVALSFSPPVYWQSPPAIKKKSDIELFEEGPIRISLTADRFQGYEPLYVSFSAYLETDDRTVREEIKEVKWVITGSRGFYREIIQESFNYQNEDENREDFFYFDFDFRTHGNYKVRLHLNDGQYVSRPVPVRVIEDLRKYQ